MKSPLRAFLLISACALAAPQIARAAGYTGSMTILYSFTGGLDGAYPVAPLISDSFGNFYGTTVSGGSSNMGTIFRLDSTGQLTTLYTFPPSYGHPNYAMTLTRKILFGTALGGTNSKGVIFSINPDGTNFQVLHNFDGADGNGPGAQLIPVAGGALAGVAGGGASGDGVLYLYLPDGKVQVLHNFNGSDGDGPDTLVADRVGDLFGSTAIGGPGCATNRKGCGVIFEFAAQTHQFKVIYDFTGGADCSDPYLGSVDSVGRLYGVTTKGKTGAPNGIAFVLTPTNGAYQFSQAAALNTIQPISLSEPGPVPGPGNSLVGSTDTALYDIVDGRFYHADFYAQGVDGISGPLLVSPHGTIYATCAQGGPCGTYGAVFSYSVTKN